VRTDPTTQAGAYWIRGRTFERLARFPGRWNGRNGKRALVKRLRDLLPRHPAFSFRIPQKEWQGDGNASDTSGQGHPNSFSQFAQTFDRFLDDDPYAPRCDPLYPFNLVPFGLVHVERPKMCPPGPSPADGRPPGALRAGFSARRLDSMSKRVRPPVRLAEVVASMSLATDLGLGQRWSMSSAPA
jgi:hypothetical protein